MASSMMTFSRAIGRGLSFGDSHLPEWNMAFGNKGFVCSMTDKDFDTIPVICESQPSFWPSPFLTEPLRGPLQSFAPVKLGVVSHSPSEPLWDSLMRQYHYLGYQNLLGRRLKYMTFIKDRPVAALSFSAPALKLRVRDRYIGWSAEQKKILLQ